MTDNVKHNITKLYKPKKAMGEKGVFIQVIGTMGEDKCMPTTHINNTRIG